MTNKVKLLETFNVRLETSNIIAIKKPMYKKNVDANGYLKCAQKIYNVNPTAAHRLNILL